MSSFIIILLLATTTAAPVDYINRTLSGPFTLDETLACPPVENVTIPSKVEKCTKDLFVFFNCGDVVKSGFLSKTREVSMTSHPTKCNEELVTFLENDYIAVKKLSNFIFLELKTESLFNKFLSFVYAGVDDIHDWIKLFLLFLFIMIVIIMAICLCCLENSNVIPTTEPNNTSTTTSANTTTSASKTTSANTNKNRSQTSSKKKRTIFCQCIKKCRTHMCPCKAAGLECVDQCHNGTACHNLNNNWIFNIINIAASSSSTFVSCLVLKINHSMFFISYFLSFFVCREFVCFLLNIWNKNY